MAQLFSSTLVRVNSPERKLEKIKKVILNFTGRGTTNDEYITMPQLPNHSIDTFYDSNLSEDITNSINLTRNESASSKHIKILEDERERTQISINLDDISSNQSIQGNHFKIEVTDGDSLMNNETPRLIKVKITLPKGMLNESNIKIIEDENIRELGVANKPMIKDSISDNQVISDDNIIQTKGGFKPEDFSALSGNFAVFANSLIDPGSSDFNETGIVCSSPIEQELEILDKEKQETRNDTEKLNNSVEIRNGKETKDNQLVEFIKNTSASLESLQFPSLGSGSFLDSLEDFTRYLIENYKLEMADHNSNTNENVLDIQKTKFIDDLKKDNNYKENLKHSQIATQNAVKKAPSLEFKNTKKCLNSSNNLPLMGKNALLAKLNVIKQQSSKTDSEIIEGLVLERFQTFISEYYKRSFKRSISKCKSNDEDNQDIECCNSTHTEVKVNIMHGVQTVKSEEPVIENTPKVNKRDLIRNRRSCMSDPGFESGSSSLKVHNPPDLISPASSLTSYSSGSFGEFVDSGVLNNLDSLTLENRLEYNSQKFLMDALGDDVHSSKSVEEGLLHEDHSIGTSEVSALISATNSLHDTCSGHRRKSSTKTMNDIDIIDEEEIIIDSMDTSTSTKIVKYNCAILKQLENESAVQYQIIQQTTKALTLCKSVKEFEASTEQLEAERILLTATCQREVIFEEMKRIQSEESVQQCEDDIHTGSIRITNLTFHAKSSRNESLDSSRKNNDYTQYFVCIVNCGKKLFATEAVVATEDDDAQFNVNFHFDELRPDFEVSVSIYDMKQKANLKNYSHESKYHINKRSKKNCPSPHKYLTLKRRSSSKLPEPLVASSNFTLWGKATLKISDLSKNNIFKLKNVPLCSTISDEFSISMQSSVNIEKRFVGFLNVGTESESKLITWNRRWCCLENTKLKYWNYPIEVEDYEPLATLDLSYCLNSWISQVDRSICPRAKTLLLETTSGTSIFRHFLSADSLDDMRTWEKVLNSVVSSLRMWQSMKCKTFTSENDLYL